jgi:hypothetical protein
MTELRNEAIAKPRKARPFKIENALKKVAKTWSNFLAFTILMGSPKTKGKYYENYFTHN